MSHKIWRHAATIILAAPHASTGQLSVLMTQRSKSIRFMPSSYVFPGGELSTSDFDPFWQKQYDNLEEKVKANYPLKFVDNRPGAYARYSSSAVWPEIAFRVCALRELFEECGILYVYDSNEKLYKTIAIGDQTDQGQFLLSQQRAVHDSAQLFVQLFSDSNYLTPAFWTLREWSNWLTPSFTPNELRFDTVFFVLCLPKAVQFNLCSKENDNADWIRPGGMLESGEKGELSLPPPQFYELSRLKRFTNIGISRLQQFSEDREHAGVVRFCPQIGKIDQSTRVGVLPGQMGGLMEKGNFGVDFSTLCRDLVVGIAQHEILLYAGDDIYASAPGSTAEDRPLFTTDDSKLSASLHKHRAFWSVHVTDYKATIWKQMRYECNNVAPLCGHMNPVCRGDSYTDTNSSREL